MSEFAPRAAAEISPLTSDALLPSIVEPLILKKSSSAAPASNIGILFSAIPVSLVATVPNPKEVLAVAPLS